MKNVNALFAAALLCLLALVGFEHRRVSGLQNSPHKTTFGAVTPTDISGISYNPIRWSPADGTARAALSTTGLLFRFAAQANDNALWTPVGTNPIDWRRFQTLPQDINLAYSFLDDLEISTSTPLVLGAILPRSSMTILTSGSGAAVTAQAANSNDEIGVLRFSTGTTATGVAGLSKRNSVNQGVILASQTTAMAGSRVRFQTLSTGAQEYNYFSGWNVSGADKVGLLYDRTIDTHWICQTCASSVCTSTPSSVTVAINLDYKLRVWKVAGESGARFLVNDVDPCSGLQTANFPSSARIAQDALLAKTVGITTPATVDVDEVEGFFDYGGGR